MGNHIFALDIGTRSVTGIIMEKMNDKFQVLDFYTKEHHERSMRDGQIHNVVAVSEVIKEVKKNLEKRNGNLHKVCVAAAGRALKTVQASSAISLDQQPITTNETIKHLELSAVQSAQKNLAIQDKENDFKNYYCAGYSVLQYKLDNEQIGSLIDQIGDEAAVEIIATFLPKVVVESLIAALNRADLEMEALTLEPIAAIHVLIPESMRRLNVALVDIGAGTSDIAITDKSTIVAYGMVPVAGDEITEAISDHYLLDFPMAEQVKRNIVDHGKDVVKDILGFETTITYEQLIEDTADKIENLAHSIAEKIIELNSKPPKAIMLVGGGSLTPEITTALANKLKLPDNRVAIRGIDAIQNLIKTDSLTNRPDFVTPIGIAIAAEQNPVHYVSVKVNEKLIRMFEMKQLTIGDSLIQSGIEINKLYGKPGMASIITLNDKEITLPGAYGNPPSIYLNQNPATVESIIENDDEIIIHKGADGKASKVTLEQLIENIPSITIYVNEEPFALKMNFYVNNQLKSKDYQIKDNDTITLKQTKTIQEFLTQNSTEKLGNTKVFTLTVNNKKINLDKGETQIYLNKYKASMDHFLKHNDQLVIIAAKKPTVNDLLEHLDKKYWDTIRVSYNGKPIVMEQQLLTVKRNDKILDERSTLILNDDLIIEAKQQGPFIFQDVFRYVDIDLTNASGKFKIYKNNQPATFHEILQDGDQLNIEWFH
ncbi:cell division protein [Virgibacillus profundi]|uniref:Cell division protein n=1 Tax=Virgibacillus profundi TaxID=2024555 RepID=A0A2A2IFN5_9BACI|nr:cell division protein FtsA [Virgibacillus profundi]PAV30126.1 cell division protein [Virgibacillus profundi]PXY54298.1 cell division protein FtsA [Virgibacillus profundi]